MVSVQGIRSQPLFRSVRWRAGLRLIPLLCAAWAGSAGAVDVVFQGPHGSSGLAGAVPGAAGGNGQMAPPASQGLFSGDPVNTLFVIGGQGGDGGNGAHGNAGVNGGNAGAGGAGANTSADLTSTLSGPGSMFVLGAGGQGGNAGVPGAPGPGTASGAGATGGAGGNAVTNGTMVTAGNARSQVAVTALGGRGGVGSPGMASGAGGGATSNARASGSSAPLLLASNATGGAGGAAGGEGAFGGNGGAATATNGLGDASSSVPDLTMLTTATGGGGGDANLDLTTMPHANGGHGGSATANTTQANSAAYSGNKLTVSQTASGGAGGHTIVGSGGKGGNATSVIALPSLGGALSVTVFSTAIGGQGGNPENGPSRPQFEWGDPGAGGSANSQLSLSSQIPVSGGWNAEINATSTATGGIPGTNPFGGGRGAGGDASSIVHGYGRVTSTATATGTGSAVDAGNATAQAIASSNYLAIAHATASGGNSYINAGAGGTARAVASSSYFASAEAIAKSGSGRFGTVYPSSALAEASVIRRAGAAAPPSPSQPSEARAHALSSKRGQMAARSSYTDHGRGASVTTSGTVVEPPILDSAEAYTSANVGGAANATWGSQSGALVVSHASALPTAASVAPLIGSSAEVGAAFANAETLGAGTMYASSDPFTPNPEVSVNAPFTASAEFSLPFSAGSHLLLGLLQPYPERQNFASFSFAVSNDGVSLYSGSFTSASQAAGVFGGHALDLGVVHADTLDLLITFTLESGFYSFNYLVGQGDALAPVPEPGAWLLLLAGLALLAWRGGAVRMRAFEPV